VLVHAFFAATAAETLEDELRIHDAAFGEVAVPVLPGTVRLTAVVVYSHEPSEEASFVVGLRRPDGSQTANLHGLTVVTPGRYAHLELPVDLYDEGRHELLLHREGDLATVLAAYPFGVRLASA
jgi:hypothetical protein